MSLHAIEPTLPRGQRRVDGVGRLKLDSTQVLPNCRTGNTSFLCFLEDGIIKKALDLYWLVSRGVRRRTKIGDTFQDVVAEAKAVQGRLESAADSGPVGMAPLVGDDKD